MASMGFFKPTLGKVGIALVLFFLLDSSLSLLCPPIPYFGGPFHSLGLEAYPCGYISYSLSSKASNINLYILIGAIAIISYSLPCVIIFLAHKIMG